ncbi:MAG: hypothetical protein MST01_06430 [Prevotella sp.]|nr:hypothetical protein [Prevotella sp.]
MKRTFILLALVASMPLTMNAQDDMYFVPTKKNVEKSKKDYGMPKDTYYSGSNRSVDDYNRRHTECWENQLKDGSQVVAIDSLGNEIATVNVKKGKSKHDSILNDDYKYTRMMEMWDGYQCSNAYWRGYNDGRFNRWYGWSSYYDPWYYSSWYGPYSLWYDPWFYGYGGWYGGWYDPWFYGYAGWYGGWHPYYDWGWHGHYYPVYGGGGGRHWTSSVERFKDNRFSRTSSTRISGSGISRGIANSDRTNSLGTRSINRNTASRRFGNSHGDIRNVSSSRNTSYNNNSSSFNSSRSSSFSSGGGSSFSSGGSRSFGGGGGRIKSSGAGRRR